MNEITEWFKSQDYEKGVALYSNLPSCKSRQLSSLKRGKSDRNMAVIIRALREHKQENVSEKPKKKIAKPAAVIKPKPPEVEEIRKDAVHKSADSYFKKINYAELPPVLKVRYRELKDLFYDMCDLHFEMLDLPDQAEKESLKIQIQIDSLDAQRETIWRELDHWATYKTILPTKASDDFTKLSPAKLYLKKASIASSISKMEKRIEGWELKMESEQDKIERRNIALQINNTTKKLHQHGINLLKILELL